MKKWPKIEEFLNKLILLALTIINNWLHKILPEKLFTHIANLKNRIKEGQKKAKEETVSRSIKFKANAIQFVVGGAFVTQVKNVLGGVKNFYTKFSIKDFMGSIKTLIILPFLKFVEVYNKIPNGFVIGAISLIVVFSIGSYVMFDQIEAIYSKHVKSAVTKVFGKKKKEGRPFYYKLNRKQFLLENIRIPIYVESLKSISNLQMTFSVQSTNRYVRAFLKKHELEIVDHFYLTTETILPSFPLDIEGKEVIKNKIRRELNIFLKKRNVEGEVNEVFFVSILAT